MQQYCIYLRKSRADEELERNGDGETLARHRKALLELAKRLKLSIIQIYEEVVSGESIAARPVMQQLLTEVEQGLWAGVLVMEVERLARGDTMDQGLIAQTFKFSNTKIVTPSKTYDPNNEFDEEYFEFGLFMSRREYKTINRRLQRGRVASVKEGKYVASIAPYGYERVKIPDDKGYTLAIVPEHAEIVKLIFSMYVNGVSENGENRRYGIQQIARRLNEMSVPTIRHDYWQKETIRDILINPVYIGKVRWGWRKVNKQIVEGKPTSSRPRNYDEDCIIADGLHKAIIDKDMFEQAQVYIEQCPPPPVGYKNTIKNPFAGIIVCGKCGRKMTLRKATTIGKPDYIVCHCRACSNVSAQFPLIEKRILDTLKSWTVEYRVKLEQEKKENLHNGELEKSAKRIESEIQVLEKQLSATYDFLEQGIYSTEQFVERSRSISERISDAKQKQKALVEKIGTSKLIDKQRIAFIPKIEYLLSVYHSLSSPASKNDLLKEVLEKAVYIKEKSGAFKDVSANDFDLELYPKLPKN